MLQKLVQAIDAGKMTEAKLGRRKADEIRARMNYFFACHWQAKGDKAKQSEYLDKALKADPGDVDVLIACYRLADRPPDYHATTWHLIKKKKRPPPASRLPRRPAASRPPRKRNWLRSITSLPG